MKTAIIILLSVLITGCASFKIPPDVEKRIGRVAIVILTSEDAKLEKIGLTAFNNERSSISMGSVLTSTILETSKAHIAQARPSWNVVHMDYDKMQLIERLRRGGIVVTYQTEKIEGELAALARSNGLDAIILIDEYTPENRPGSGIGVWLGTKNLSSIQTAFVHAHVGVTVVGPNGKVLAVSPGHAKDLKSIDPAEFGLQYSLQANLEPAILDPLRREVVDELRMAIKSSLSRLGIQ